MTAAGQVCILSREPGFVRPFSGRGERVFLLPRNARQPTCVAQEVVMDFIEVDLIVPRDDPEGAGLWLDEMVRRGLSAFDRFLANHARYFDTCSELGIEP